MTAPSPPPLSKSLEKGELSTRRTSSSRSAHHPRDTSPSKNSISSRRSTTSKRSTSRRSSCAGQNVRAVVRNKIAERKAGNNNNNNNNNLSTSQHKAPYSSGNCNQSVLSRSSHSSTSTRGRRSLNISRSSGDQSMAVGNSSSKKGNRPGAVSPFLKSTHRQLKAEIASIQDKIIFLQDLAPMKESKKMDLLFGMIDRDGGGTVDAEELATAMRQNDELSFSASIEKAIDMVATFDVDGDGELNNDEFRNYVSAMVKEIDMSASEFCEYLIVQMLLSKETPEEQRLAGEMAKEQIKEEVKKREELFAVLNNQGMEEVFNAFDTENEGKVPFKEIAHGLYERAQELDENVQDSLEVLLMMERNDTRMLDYEQFGRLIMAVSKTAELSLEDLADALREAAAKLSERDENFCGKLVVNCEESVLGDGAHIDSLTYGRLKKLFKLWDLNNDGDISVDELAGGLGAFQKASGIDVDADAMAQALIAFDEDGDNQLDPREFAHAMVQYANQFGVEISGLIDAMVLLSSKKIENEEKAEDFQADFQDVFGASSAFLTGTDDLWAKGESSDFHQAHHSFWMP